MPEGSQVLLRRMVLAWLAAAVAGLGIFVCVKPVSWLAILWFAVLLLVVLFGLTWTRGCRIEGGARVDAQAGAPASIAGGMTTASSEEDGQLLSVAGHDLRQPMQAIAMYAATLAAFDLPENARQLVAGLETASETLSLQFEEVIAIAKLGAGRTTFEVKPVSLGTVFDSVVATQLQVAHDKSLHLRAVSTRLRVQADEAQLVRLLERVVAHAVRTTESGGVLLGCRRRGNDVVIEVRASSGGVAPEQAGDVFVPFSNYGLRLPDRGLGLVLAERLARAMGGELSLRVETGRGDVYALRMPRLRGSGLL